jgi:hypothetical protein
MGVVGWNCAERAPGIGRQNKTKGDKRRHAPGGSEGNKGCENCVLSVEYSDRSTTHAAGKQRPRVVIWLPFFRPIFFRACNIDGQMTTSRMGKYDLSAVFTSLHSSIARAGERRSGLSCFAPVFAASASSIERKSNRPRFRVQVQTLTFLTSILLAEHAGLRMLGAWWS